MSQPTWLYPLTASGFVVAFALAMCEVTEARAPSPSARFSSITNSIGMQLVRIPPGRFLIGSPESEKGNRIFTEDQREMTIDKEFWMGIYEVTQKQFKEVMRYNPSFFSVDGTGKPGVVYYRLCPPAGGADKVPVDTSDFPVENVSYNDAREFCKKLTARPDERGRIYRLPRDAEWEYVCRGNARAYQVFHFGNSLSSRQANFDGQVTYYRGEKSSFLGRTCMVGSYAKNRFGLYDMHGNVDEWCSGYSGNDAKLRPRSKDEPQPPPSDPAAVVRGGCWDDEDVMCRSACRGWSISTARSSRNGFRVVLRLSGK